MLSGNRNEFGFIAITLVVLAAKKLEMWSHFYGNS